MNIAKQNIKIKDLILWDENARFPDKYYNSDEKELINYFVSKPEYKIKQLAEAIVKDIEYPQLEKLVVWNDENNFVVLEGNRRLTVYKLLINPELTQNKNLHKYLTEQNRTLIIDDNFELECLVTNDKEEAFRYIDRKHANGNNEINWGAVEKVNYTSRRGSETANNHIKLGITSIVKSLDLPEEMKEKILGKGFVTNFFRVITTTPAKKKYGYKILEDGTLEVENKNFEKELKVVIYSLLNKEDFDGNKIDSRTLNKTEQIEDFIKSIKHEDAEKVDTQITKNSTENLFGDKSINIGNSNAKLSKTEPNDKKIGSKPTPTGLFHSSDVPFKIKSASLKILYDELKVISLKDFPNATHDLLRSFLECSLIFFFKDISEFDTIKKSDSHNPKLGEMLTHIINGKCSKINDRNLIETLKQVKSEYDQPYSLERMNMINHNENCASSEKDVRKAWAQLEALFKVILIHSN